MDERERERWHALLALYEKQSVAIHALCIDLELLERAHTRLGELVKRLPHDHDT